MVREPFFEALGLPRDILDFCGQYQLAGLCFGAVLTLLEGNQCFQQALHFEKQDYQCEEQAFKPNGLIPWIVNDITSHLLLLGLVAGWNTITLGSTGTTQSDLEAYSARIVHKYIAELSHPTLIQNLVRRADNMFLYLFFLEEIMENEDTQFCGPNQRLAFLQNTPPNIYRMYSSYILCQLRGTTQSKDRILIVLLQFLLYSPSPVTSEILQEALRLHIPSSKLPAMRTNDMYKLARHVAGVLFNVQETTAGKSHLIPVHRTLVEYFLSSPGSTDAYNVFETPGWEGADRGLLGRLKTVYMDVAHNGPHSILEICCKSNQSREFQVLVHRYQHCADVWRQTLSDAASRGRGFNNNSVVLLTFLIATLWNPNTIGSLTNGL
ncbi:hypothetical protein B0H14DRAFT_2605907 [Mycena olivaceomarginata]|nr:hypothetical protein B0H14DRAFT_2605907 [Mycena olivaceomarginata]